MTTHDDTADVLTTYARAMGACAPDLAASCWTTDGVLMGATLPTAIGPAINETYVQVFAAMSFEFTFTIDELIVIDDTLVYGCTHSNGTQTVLWPTTSKLLARTTRFFCSATKTAPERLPATCSTRPPNYKGPRPLEPVDSMKERATRHAQGRSS
jgi:hypothetical protein